MADLLKSASDWLAGQARSHLASRVTYARGASAVRLPAGRGRSAFQSVDAGGAGTLETDAEDFLIDPADLVLDGFRVLPQKGDRVTDAAGDVCEVHAPGAEPCWRWCDGHKNRLRVHTKLVERAEP